MTIQEANQNILNTFLIQFRQGKMSKEDAQFLALRLHGGQEIYDKIEHESQDLIIEAILKAQFKCRRGNNYDCFCENRLSENNNIQSLNG